jgi:hypothetical protein
MSNYEPPVRHCCCCDKELEEFEGEFLTGQQVYDNISGINYNTGQIYCKKCFSEMTGGNIKSDTDSSIPKLSKKDTKKLRFLLIEWEDDNISDYDYCNRVGDILGLGKWTCKGMKEN